MGLALESSDGLATMAELVSSSPVESAAAYAVDLLPSSTTSRDSRSSGAGIGDKVAQFHAELPSGWKAALLGLSLIGTSEPLREAIRLHLVESRAPIAERRIARLSQVDGRSVRSIEGKRRKLLDLYYSEKISPDLFAAEDRRLKEELERGQVELSLLEAQESRLEQVAEQFENVARVLADLDITQAWEAATDPERRILVEELLGEVALFPDHLEVEVAGAPRINVLLEEVGLGKPSGRPKRVQTVGVRGGT